ncbi:MAG: hypothetical protein ACYC26_03450 [Phycisphaerales bacterium]
MTLLPFWLVTIGLAGGGAINQADQMAAARPIRVAILAPINRIGKEHDSVGSAIVLATGAAVDQAGGVLRRIGE